MTITSIGPELAMLVTLPNVLAIDSAIARNPVRQVAVRDLILEGTLIRFHRRALKGLLFRPTATHDEVLVVPKARFADTGDRRVILASSLSPDNPDLSSAKWVKHPLLQEASADHSSRIEQVRESWLGAFSYVQENREADVSGLRLPQLGAIHAAHAHWSITGGPGTVVMPTGTGKTDAMIAILVTERCSKLLIVVPTDALRTQLSDKFLTLGVLKSPGSPVLTRDALFPIVATLLHVPRTVQDVDQIFAQSQVIITTSAIAGQCAPEIQQRMADLCPYLFIDEAHHIEAPTWKAFKEKFRDRRVLQFTATPFREDGKLLDGDIIYRYPLRKAQQEGHFRPIRFVPVEEFNPLRVDRAIATQAIAQLRTDAAKGHILMARVDSVKRAREVFELYQPHTEFRPVQLHTGIHSARERHAARQMVLSGESRIVVCVDMLGEGFDLPELKIAAFHDIRRTLAVTLQLAGRFTRSRPDLGDPTFIANDLLGDFRAS